MPGVCAAGALGPIAGCRAPGPRSGFRRTAGLAGPLRAAGRRLLRLLGIAEAKKRIQLRAKGADEGAACRRGRAVVGGFGGRRLRLAEIPPQQADEQHGARGAQHQRETLDQRIAAVDQEVLQVADFASMEHPVGARHRAEKNQRGLNDRGEHAVLPHGQHRGHAAGYIEAGEDVGQILLTGVDRIPDGRRGHGDDQGRPPRHAWDIGVDRPVASLDRRSCPLFWHM